MGRPVWLPCNQIPRSDSIRSTSSSSVAPAPLVTRSPEHNPTQPCSAQNARGGAGASPWTTVRYSSSRMLSNSSSRAAKVAIARAKCGKRCGSAATDNAKLVDLTCEFNCDPSWLSLLLQVAPAVLSTVNHDELCVSDYVSALAELESESGPDMRQWPAKASPLLRRTMGRDYLSRIQASVAHALVEVPDDPRHPRHATCTPKQRTDVPSLRDADTHRPEPKRSSQLPWCSSALPRTQRVRPPTFASGATLSHERQAKSPPNSPARWPRGCSPRRRVRGPRWGLT